MPETGYYEKRPRPQHMRFLVGALKSRRNVKSVSIRDDFRLLVTRHNQSDVQVYLSNMYELGVADVVEILRIAPETTCIVSTMDYNHYSSEAKALARERGVGLFKARDFLGAVNFDRERFLDYVPPSERERAD